MSDRFFIIRSASNGTLSSVDSAKSTISRGDPGRIATYVLSVNDTTQPCSFVIEAKSLDSTTKTVYGKKTGAAQRTITSSMTVVGNRHGVTKDIPITYLVDA